MAKRKLGKFEVVSTISSYEKELEKAEKTPILQEFIERGDMILGAYRNVDEFVSFKPFWFDRSRGIEAILGRLRSQPETFAVQSIWFARKYGWTMEDIRRWLLEHDYLHGSFQPSIMESLSPSHIAELILKNKSPKEIEAINVAINLVISEQKEKGPFQCAFCTTEPFETREDLEAHMRASHPEAVQETAKKIQERHFQEEEYRRQQMRRKGALLRLRRKRVGMREER